VTIFSEATRGVKGAVPHPHPRAPPSLFHFPSLEIFYLRDYLSSFPSDRLLAGCIMPALPRTRVWGFCGFEGVQRDHARFGVGPTLFLPPHSSHLIFFWAWCEVISCVYAYIYSGPPKTHGPRLDFPVEDDGETILFSEPMVFLSSDYCACLRSRAAPPGTT